jgi:hypothetical protein
MQKDTNRKTGKLKKRKACTEPPFIGKGHYESMSSRVDITGDLRTVYTF